ncbi:MAG: type II toxin-antitoxin system VapC family toxin [Methanosarcinaceae archaeon]
MKYLLDTCVVSELIKKVPDEKVIQWIKVSDEEIFFLSVLTIGEIQKGIAKLPDSRRKFSIQRWLDRDLLERFSQRILTITIDIATAWGQIQGESESRGEPIPTIDGLIGATAIAHNLTVVTRNEKDLKKTGARIFNPWKLC